MQTLCRAATRSSASFHRKIYPSVRQKRQTARSIPSKQNRENGLLRSIQACVASSRQTWFLTEWSSFPARLERNSSLEIATGLQAERSTVLLKSRNHKIVACTQLYASRPQEGCMEMRRQELTPGTAGAESLRPAEPAEGQGEGNSSPQNQNQETARLRRERCALENNGSQGVIQSGQG